MDVKYSTPVPELFLGCIVKSFVKTNGGGQLKSFVGLAAAANAIMSDWILILRELCSGCRLNILCLLGPALRLSGVHTAC